jgi:hypothetical protein
MEFGLKITFSGNDPNVSLALDDIGRIGAHYGAYLTPNGKYDYQRHDYHAGKSYQ